MSLINEALRRTRDAAYQNAPRSEPPPASAYQLDPNEPNKPKPQRHANPLDRLSHSPKPTRLVLTVLLSAICLGGLLFATYRFAIVFPRARMDYMPATDTPPPLGPAGLPEHLRNLTFEPPPPTPPAAVEPAPAQPAPAVTAPAIPAPPSAPPVVAPVPPAPAPEMPKLKVRGFSKIGSIREAMINGRQLRVGDSILGAKILAIDNPVVTYEFNGRQYEISSHDE